MKRPTAIRIPTRSDGNDLLITCSRAVELGVDGVEWAVGAGDLFEVPAPGTDFPEVVSVAAECALTEISPAIDRVNNLLQQSAQVGARCLALGLPGVSFEAGSGCFSRYQEVLDFVYALLREVRFEAEACGVPIAVEAMRDQSLMSPSELRGIVDGANSWAVGVCVDTGRLAGRGHAADWIETLGRRVHLVRLGTIGEGGVPAESDLVGLASALDSVPIDRPIVGVALPSPDRLRAAADWLCRLSGAP